MSEWGLMSQLTQCISFRRGVFPVNHLHWYRQPNQNNQETEHPNNITQCKMWSKLTAQQTHSKKLRLRDRTDRAWFSRLSRHPARKRSSQFLQHRSPGTTMLIVWQEGHPACKTTERCYAHNDHVRIVL